MYNLQTISPKGISLIACENIDHLLHEVGMLIPRLTPPPAPKPRQFGPSGIMIPTFTRAITHEAWAAALATMQSAMNRRDYTTALEAYNNANPYFERVEVMVPIEQPRPGRSKYSNLFADMNKTRIKTHTKDRTIIRSAYWHLKPKLRPFRVGVDWTTLYVYSHFQRPICKLMIGRNSPNNPQMLMEVCLRDKKTGKISSETTFLPWPKPGPVTIDKQYDRVTTDILAMLFAPTETNNMILTPVSGPAHEACVPIWKILQTKTLSDSGRWVDLAWAAKICKTCGHFRAHHNERPGHTGPNDDCRQCRCQNFVD